jgi:hypothetical protein
LILTILVYFLYVKYKNQNINNTDLTIETSEQNLSITGPTQEVTNPIAEIVEERKLVITPSIQKTDPAKQVEKSPHQIFREFCAKLSDPEKITLKDNLGHKNTGLNFPKTKRYQIIDLSKDKIDEVKVSVEGLNPPKGIKIQYAFCEGVNFCEGDQRYQYRVGSRWQNSNTYTLKVKPGNRTVEVDFKLLGVNPEWAGCEDFTDNEAKPNGFFRFQFINSSSQ